MTDDGEFRLYPAFRVTLTVLSLMTGSAIDSCGGRKSPANPDSSVPMHEAMHRTENADSINLEYMFIVFIVITLRQDQFQPPYI